MTWMDEGFTALHLESWFKDCWRRPGLVTGVVARKLLLSSLAVKRV
jgi:hypothetical protein